MDFKIDNKNTFFQKPLIVALLALFCCFLWGSAFVVIKLGFEAFNIEASDIYNKILFAGIRFFISGFVVLLMCLIFKYSVKVNRVQLRQLVVLALLQTCTQYTFFYMGLANTTGTNGAILTSLSTFFSVILAHFFYKIDKLSIKKLLGVSLGFLGIVILNFSGIGNFKFIGEGFIIIAAIMASIASIYIKKLSGYIKPFAIAGYQLFIGGTTLIIIGFIGNGGNSLDFTLEGTLILLYLAFVSACAFSLWTLLLKYNGVSKVSIYKFSAPLFGIILSFIILGERYINISLFISIFFVSIGIILINTDRAK